MEPTRTFHTNSSQGTAQPDVETSGGRETVRETAASVESALRQSRRSERVNEGDELPHSCLCENDVPTTIPAFAGRTYKLSSCSDRNIIAIDGPAASGKSTVACLIAQKLGFVFVSSGHYYRALAWGALQQNLDPSQEKSIASWLRGLDFQTNIIEGEARPLLNHMDPKEHLFDTAVNALVSRLAALPEVRNFLLTKLRDLALDHDLVMEGRDIGSVVFPNTRFKFYLDASLEERMRRRRKEGETDAIAERDRSDSSRAFAPLLIPKGATVIDTTHSSIEEVVEKIIVHLPSETLYSSQQSVNTSS